MSEKFFQSGRFRVLAVIAVGGQGTVYKAVCEKDGFEKVEVGTVVMLTAMSVAGYDRKNISRLQKRMAELGALAHPGVARCFGCFCESGPFGDMHVLVKEWLEGETLKDKLLRTPQGLDADEVLRIGEKLLSALVYVSSRGVVHRNIKPGHVFLCADGNVKVVDFWMPQPEELVVPPERNKNDIFDYLAPDLVDPKFLGDEQSDVFSVGVCLHEMLTGRLPYQSAGGLLADRNRVIDFFDRWRGVSDGDDSIKINPLVNRLLAGAADVLAKALRPNRAERYATFADFAAAFKGIRCRELAHGENTWQLLQHVGRGGFGEVFKAREIKTGQIVAIKHLLKSRYADRLRREARVLSSLNDSSIVRFITFFEKEMDGCEHAFLVMEYLEGMPGKTLRDELRRASGKAIRRDLVVRAFVNYAHGLAVLHAKRIIHRDIKPSKLYFPVDALGRAKIMSSTIVRDPSGTVTCGEVPGALDYTPPEVVMHGDRGGPEMDIYALGLCLYEALSGKMACSRLPPALLADGLNADGIRLFLERSKKMIPPPLDESSYSDLPDLVRLVREMTGPDVAKRLKDAAEVERRLRALSGRAFMLHDRPCPVYGCPKYRGVRKLLGGLWDDVKTSMRIKR